MHTSSWYISITSLRSLANSHLQSKVPRITLWEPAPYFERRCRGPGPSAQQAQTPPSTPPAASSPAHGCQGDPSAGEGVLPCWGPRATRQQDQVEEGPVPGRSQGRNPSGLAVSCPRRPPREGETHHTGERNQKVYGSKSWKGPQAVRNKMASIGILVTLRLWKCALILHFVNIKPVRDHLIPELSIHDKESWDGIHRQPEGKMEMGKSLEGEKIYWGRWCAITPVWVQRSKKCTGG